MKERLRTNNFFFEENITELAYDERGADACIDTFC